MTVTYIGPVRINKRIGSTNTGGTPTNAAGFTIGDNTAATTVSQEFWVYQPTAANGNLPLYQVGIGGTVFSGGAISIPNVGQASAQVIGTLPSGSRIQSVTYNLIQAPTAITTGSITLSINGTAIGTLAIGTSIGFGSMSTTTVLAGLRLLSYTSNDNSVLTASLSGTGITGSLLAEISVQYSVKNADGSLTPQGQGLANG